MTTLRDLWNAYLQGHVMPHCRTAPKMARMWRDYFKEFAARPADSIKRFEIKVWHGQLGQQHGQVAANHALAQLSAIYNKAIEWDLFTAPNPASRISKFKIPGRTRYLTQEQVVAFLAAVDRLKNPVMRDYYKVLLFTGQRKTNVLEMKWSQVDLDNGIWRIPRTKNGQPHAVPLIGATVEILRRRSLRRRTSDWVFPGAKPGDRFRQTQASWASILRRSGLQDLRIHDLRHTHASWQAMTGTDLPIIMRTLAHRDVKSTMRYLHLNSLPVRGAMERAVEAMLH